MQHVAGELDTQRISEEREVKSHISRSNLLKKEGTIVELSSDNLVTRITSH